MKTLSKLIAAYQVACIAHLDLVKKHDGFVMQQRQLLSPIKHAEAERNKAREAMMQAIEQGNESAAS